VRAPGGLSIAFNSDAAVPFCKLPLTSKAVPLLVALVDAGGAYYPVNTIRTFSTKAARLIYQAAKVGLCGFGAAATRTRR
jgi:hypothetical protein